MKRFLLSCAAVFVFAPVAQAAPCVYAGSVPTFVRCIAAQASEALDLAMVNATAIAGMEHGSTAFQQILFVPSTLISTSTDVELAVVTVDVIGPVDVRLDTHVYIERPDATTGRYDLTLRQGDCSGTPVGATFWRPSTSTDVYQADSVSFTGYAMDVVGPTDFVLCANVFDTNAPDATAGMRGLIASW